MVTVHPAMEQDSPQTVSTLKPHRAQITSSSLSRQRVETLLSITVRHGTRLLLQLYHSDPHHDKNLSESLKQPSWILNIIKHLKSVDKEQHEEGHHPDSAEETRVFETSAAEFVNISRLTE